MTSIIPRLNCSYRRDDGQYPVVIQIIRHRKKREIDTPFQLWKDEFNAFTGQAINRPEYCRVQGTISRVNRSLAFLCAELQAISDDLYRRKGETYTAADVADAYKCRKDLTQLFVFADSLIADLNNRRRLGTANNYRSACNALERFLNSRILSLNDFTFDLVDRFVEYLEHRGNQPNTVVFYLKQLRAIYNKALKMNILSSDLQPFCNHTLREEVTRKRALPKKEVLRLEYADLTGSHRDVYLVRDLFIGSIYLRGMAFVDLCYLKKENIEGDYLCYRRRKTKQPLRIRIEKPLKDLFARYMDPDSVYLFPMLRKCASEENLHKEYLNAKNRLGKRIRELGLRLSLEFPLTFHVARHTWATLAHNAGIETPIISSSLGHTSEKTTRIYLAEMDPKLIDYANRLVLNLLK